MENKLRTVEVGKQARRENRRRKTNKREENQAALLKRNAA